MKSNTAQNLFENLSVFDFMEHVNRTKCPLRWAPWPTANNWLLAT